MNVFKLIQLRIIMFLAWIIKFTRLFIVSTRAGAAGLGSLIVTFILILVGIALTPTIQEEVVGVTGTGGNNLTGAAATMMGLAPLFWVILVLSAGIVAVYVQFKQMT